jgi:hypothetical protein
MGDWQADSLLAAPEQAGQFLQPAVALSISNASVEEPGDRIGQVNYEQAETPVEHSPWLP